jgi:formylglycine-generating enzyme required for sulfatase activity
VGGKLPNPWGFYDMLGNVWDWCWDVYDAEVYGSYRVLRGGGWFDEQWSCRASARRRSHPSYQVDDVGFRVARSAMS